MIAHRRRANGTQLAGFLTVFFSVTMLFADTPFRWRLEPEQSYQLQVNWTSGLSRPSFEITQRAQAQLNWKILGVDEAGNIEFIQTLTGVNQTIDCPSVGPVSYDSRVEAEPQGVVSDIAAYWRPLMGVESRQRLSPRGEILPLAEGVSVPQPKDTSLLRRDFNQDTWRAILRAGFPVFPEGALAVGENWVQKVETVLPSLPTRCTWQTQYTYTGIEEGEGATPLEKFRLACQLIIESAAEAPQMEIQTQASDGELLFDEQAGYLVSSWLNHSLTLYLTQPGVEPMRTRISSSVQVQFAPVIPESDPATEATATITLPSEAVPTPDTRSSETPE
jgi:hypothetical protein